MVIDSNLFLLQNFKFFQELPVKLMVYGALFSLLTSSALLAQEVVERIEVLGERSRLADRLGVSTYVIDRAEIERKNYPSVAQYLQKIPGVTVKKTGAAGGVISLTMRGVGPGNVLILMDGVAVGDPSEISGNFDLTHISVADVEAIEVYKGAQAVAFGTNALAGIINIVSSKDASRNSVYAGLGTGSYQRFGAATHFVSESRAVSGRLNIESLAYDYGSETADDLISAESDPYERLSGSAFARYAGEGWYASGQFKATNSQKDLDGYNAPSFEFTDDENYVAAVQSRVVQLQAGAQWGLVALNLDLSETATDRVYRDQLDGPERH